VAPASQSRNAPPAAALSPSVIIDMPSKNNPIPPSAEAIVSGVGMASNLAVP
jgi:hypothetical protein